MGASYSYHFNTNSSNSPSIIPDSLNDNKDIFVLFMILELHTNLLDKQTNNGS